MDLVGILPWQETRFAELQRLRSAPVPALLFYGQAGTGKVRFARTLGQALLCEAPDAAGHPCRACAACRWVESGSHPDFRLVRPEAVALAEGAAADADDTEEGGAASIDAESAKKRAPSREIRIDEARALGEFLARTAHRGARRIVVIYPAEAMNVYTANALLKMLEEPPPATLFFLVSDALHRLLPTIVSRCQKVPMTLPEAALALPWLAAEGATDALAFLAEAGGAPLAALALAVAERDVGQAQSLLFQTLAAPALEGLLAAAERLARLPSTDVVGWLQRWTYDCLSYRMTGRIRYYPQHAVDLSVATARLDVAAGLAYARMLDRERRVAEHPLNARLFVENLLLAYLDAWGGARPELRNS